VKAGKKPGKAPAKSSAKAAPAKPAARAAQPKAAASAGRGAAPSSGSGGKQGMGKVRPLRDRVLVKRVEEHEQKVGGIIVPDTAKEKPQQAEVVAVGSGRVLENGQREPLAVKAGDKVLVGKWSGTEVKLDGTEYLIVKEDEILGILH
jgi:chaperonin GroES